MEFAGREGKSWLAVVLLCSLVYTVHCAPMDNTGEDCFEPCKDMDDEEAKEQCVLKLCPDLDMNRPMGGFVNSDGEDQFEPYDMNDKRASHFVRIGKLSPSSFVRIGKANPGSFVRIGRANRNAFVRIGKSLPHYFMRMIKGNPSSFVRIGRSNPGSFVRIGKSLEDANSQMSEEDKRMGNFVRIGKANPGQFVRIGKGNPSSFVRIGKASPSSFVRIGKSVDVSDQNSVEDQKPVHTRQDPSTFLRLGK